MTDEQKKTRERETRERQQAIMRLPVARHFRGGLIGTLKGIPKPK